MSNDGIVPSHTWLRDNGYWTSYEIMCQYPAAFGHLRYASDKKFEIYQTHNECKSGTPEILPPVKKNVLAPANYKTIADYDVPCARFSPTECRINEGVSEQEWLAVGGAISHVQQSCFFWVGDWALAGFRLFGKKVTGDLAQQATGYSRQMLHICVRVARRFPPERRRDEVTFFHHLVLCKFLPELADQLLAEACEYGYTAKQIRAMADEAIGKKKDTHYHTVTLRLSDEMFNQLKDCAPGPLRWWIPQVIIHEFLQAKKEAAE